VDRWLCAARVFKSRAQATQACSGGHVRVNEAHAKSHLAVRIGDQVQILTERGLRILEIVALADKRQSPVRARELYLDHSPPPPPKEEPEGGPVFDRGRGRPTKRDRRVLRGLRGR